MYSFKIFYRILNMKKLILKLLGIALSLMVLNVYAGDKPKNGYDPTEVRCYGLSDGDSEFVKSINRYIETANDNLPNIPPEEAKYISDEKNAISKLSTQNSLKPDAQATVQINQRFTALTQRRTYYAWIARNDLVALKSKFEHFEKFINGHNDELTTYRKNNEAEKLTRIISNFFLFENLSFSLKEFLIRQEYIAPPLITRDQYDKLFWVTSYMTFMASEYAGCKLAKIMGWQSFD